MALKLSSGLRNFLLDMGSLRKAFENGVLEIYSGTAPASADDAATGVKLCRITKSSGAVAAGEKGTQKVISVTVTNADTLTTVSLGGVDYTYDPGGSMPVATIAVHLARAINETCPMCVAVPTGDSGTLYVMSRTDGDTFSAAGTANCTVADKATAVDTACLSFAASAASGAITKNSDVWSGVGIADGAAGYFRLVTSNDTGAQSTTQIRLQGSIATSGADLNLSNVNVKAGATITVDTFTITMPAS